MYHSTITLVRSSRMICHIETGNGIAIYEQIERQVKFAIAIANGSLVGGERIPSVRQLATQTAVNVNTVALAYRDLQQQGILNSIRGTGLTVSADASATCALRKLQRKVADDDMSEELLMSTNTELAALCTTLDEAAAVPGFAVIKNRYSVYLPLLMRRGYLWERFASAPTVATGTSRVGMARWPTSLINSNFSERVRFVNVLSQVAKLSVGEFDQAHSKSCIRWLATTGHADFDLHQDLFTTVEDRLRRSIIPAERATQTIVALQIYRRQHGQFPAHLLELDKFDYGRSVPNHTRPAATLLRGFGAALTVVSDDSA